MSVPEILVPKLTDLSGVVAVSLGGSRARGTHRPDSDWDVGVYYRGSFDARLLADLGFDGHVVQPGGWGRIINGGAWISVDGQPVDLLLRDLDVIDVWHSEAKQGQFEIDNVEGHLAGLPTYTPLGEISVNRVLAGQLPTVDYPAALRTTAKARWRWNAAFSLLFAEQYAEREDHVLALGMMARATVQAAHAIEAGRGEWVLNEKRLIDSAGLSAAHQILGVGNRELPAALKDLRTLIDPPRLDELSAHDA